MSAIIHRFHAPLAVAAQLLGGKTLTRTLFNMALPGHTVAGRVLDLGSKNANGSYYEHLTLAPGVERVFTDLQEAPGVIHLDVERPFPLADAAFDAVLSFHLFEHIYHFDRAPAEIRRILKPGGRLLICVPFQVEYHADPDDFFRFTDSALRRLFEEAGLVCTHMEAIGEGPVTALASRLPTFFLPRPLRPACAALLYLAATPFDRLLGLRPRVNGKALAERFALEFFAVFEKREE